MKVFLLLRDNEPLRPENLLLVGRKKDAEQLIGEGFATYYEPIQVLSGAEVSRFFQTKESRG